MSQTPNARILQNKYRNFMLAYVRERERERERESDSDDKLIPQKRSKSFNCTARRLIQAFLGVGEGEKVLLPIKFEMLYSGFLFLNKFKFRLR